MAEPDPKPLPVAVIGGGWAGLSAAVTLCRAGVPATLFEAGRQLGGRARCVPFDDLRVDNGQHLVIGAYHGLLELLEIVGVDTARAFARLPLTLYLRRGRRRLLDLQARRLPAPLHLAAGILGARGLSPVDRLRLLRFALRLQRGQIRPTRDVTAQAVLIAERQSGRLLARLWGPLCLAAMNTPLNRASARLFLTVLQRSLAGDRGAADFLVPRTDLCSLLPTPAYDYIGAHGGQVQLSQRLLRLEQTADGDYRLHFRSGSRRARRVILAVNPTLARRLLAPLDIPELAGLGRLVEAPICTVYLRYEASVRQARPVEGWLDGLCQWSFDRRLCGQPGLMAVVISGRGPHLELDNEALAAAVAAELAEAHPDWPPPLATRVVREKRATFEALPEVDNLRPPNGPVRPGLFLAGDFTRTGLPATLEGAVLSGREAAEQLLRAQGDGRQVP